MAIGPLDYEGSNKPRERTSTLAVVVFALGCVFALPVQVSFIFMGGEKYFSPAFEFFFPPCAVMVLALVAILGLRWDVRKRGLGFAVAGFWLGLLGLATAALLKAAMEFQFGLIT